MSGGKEEKFRLRFLIKECGKAIFKHKVEDTLEEILLDPNNAQTITYLKENHVITEEQLNLLNLDSGSPSVTDFDFTLWLVLLRTFFCEKPYDDPVWYKSNKPDDDDLSVEAEIVRIRDYKNEIENSDGRIDTEENFKKSFEDLSQIFLRVGNDINGLENMIADVKTMKFDLAKDEEVMKDFRIWTEMEEMFEPGLDLSISESKRCRLKLITLLVDGGARVFRNVLDDRTPPAELCEILKKMKDNKMPHKFLQKYQRRLLLEKEPLPSSKDFDVTLLTVFLQEICGFKPNEKTNDQQIANDILLIKNHRNKISHLSKTRGLTEDEFKKIWQEISQALVRLNNTCRNQIPNLQCEIDELERSPIDLTREDELQRILDEWRKREENLESIITKSTATSRAINRTKEVVKDVRDETFFVMTKQFEEARQKLRDNYIIVLDGAPGEGKTTIAKKLLHDVSKNERYIQLNTYLDWTLVDFDTVDAILIDDIFGSGIFDKKEHRKWKKHIPSIAAAVDSKSLFVIITSRCYILTEAVENSIINSIFTKDNIFTLSSKHLSHEEKEDILKKHFNKADKDISSCNLKELMSKFDEFQPKSPAASFIGFPECARLFSNNCDLFEKGPIFFESPMVSVKSYLSEIFKDDDTFVAFFVLWAQTSKTLSSIELELPVNETADEIRDPIVRLQFRPEDHLRKIRAKFQKHRGGFIHFDSTKELFSFSHRVVLDAVGLVAFEMNKTATISCCDTAFIENYVQIGTPRYDSDRSLQCTKNDQQSFGEGKAKEIVSTSAEMSVVHEHTLNISVPRYDKLISKIEHLTIGRCVNTDSQVSQYLRPSLFMLNIFENETFCARFFVVLKENDMLQKLLMMPVRTIGGAFEEFMFLKMRNSEIRLPSYLVWIKERINPLTERCFDALLSLDSEEKEKELSMAMLISTKLGKTALINYFLQKGGEINSNLMSLALYNDNKELFYQFLRDGRNNSVKDEVGFLHETCKLGYTKIVSKLIQMGVSVLEPDKAGLYPIHHAICGGHLETVKVLLKHDESQADFSSDAEKLSVFHFAAIHKQSQIIDELLARGKRPTKYDKDGRTPFLFALYKNAATVFNKMLDLAIEDELQCQPDKDNNTPLYIAVERTVKCQIHHVRKVFEDLAKSLCEYDKNLHLENHKGDTPLKLACKEKLVDIVNEIIKHEDPYRKMGRSIFHQIVLDGNSDSIGTLLQSKIDPNMLDDHGRTPFMFAKEIGKTNIVKQLQADPRVTKYNQQTEQGNTHDQVSVNSLDLLS